MDDGGKDGSGLRISTNNFTENEVDKLINILNLKYELECYKRSQKHQYIIYIPKKSIEKLYNIINEYLVPSMRYKFNK